MMVYRHICVSARLNDAAEKATRLEEQGWELFNIHYANRLVPTVGSYANHDADVVDLWFRQAKEGT